MLQVNTFRQNVGGVFVPFVRDEGKLQQVTAAAQPGPAYYYLKAPEKELGLIGNRGGGKTHTMVLRLLSGVGRGWGSHYNCVLLRSSLREMTDLVTMVNGIVQPIWRFVHLRLGTSLHSKVRFEKWRGSRIASS